MTSAPIVNLLIPSILFSHSQIFPRRGLNRDSFCNFHFSSGLFAVFARGVIALTETGAINEGVTRIK